MGSFEAIDLWVPLSVDPAAAQRDDRSLRVTARLKNGASFEQAAAELVAIARNIEQAHQQTNAGWSAQALKLRDAIVGRDTWQILALLTIVVAFVLVVACANIANMMLARAIARQKEMAVRVALGATRGRLVRQIVTESIVLGLGGGLFGLLVTRAGIKGIQTISDDYVFRHLTVSGHLLAFTFALSVLAPLVFSLLPALHASRTDLSDALKDASHRASGGPTGRRSRSVLVVSQLALALMLLFVAALAARSVAAFKREPPGIQTSNVLTELRNAVAFGERVLERLASVAGVRQAAAMSVLPLVASEPSSRFVVVGRPSPSSKDRPWANTAAITPDYLHVFDLVLRDGRSLSRYDDALASQVALVNREAVRRYWPTESPIGRRIQLQSGDEHESPAIEIVGVVDDVKSDDLSEPAPPRIYRSLAQAPQSALAFAVRTTDKATTIAPAIRDVLRGVDRDVAISEMRSLDTIMRARFAENYVLVGLFGTFAVVALVLAGTGLYGVTAYAVSQRTQEIGIRMALGATRRNVLSLVVSQNARLIVVGSLIGVAGGAVLGRAMRSMLFRVGPADPAMFATAIAMLAAIALVATYVPARRASHIDPLLALRHE